MSIFIHLFISFFRWSVCSQLLHSPWRSTKSVVLVKYTDNVDCWSYSHSHCGTHEGSGATDLSPFLPAHALQVPVPGFKTDCVQKHQSCPKLRQNVTIQQYCTNHAISVITGTTSEFLNARSALCPVLQPRVHSLSHQRFQHIELIELVHNKTRFDALGQETVPTRARSRCAWTLVQSLYQPDSVLSGLR